MKREERHREMTRGLWESVGLKPQQQEAFNNTDLGNARRLVAHHGQDLRYCHPWNSWLVWDGRRWKVDDSGEIERRAKLTVAAIYREASTSTDADTRKALAKHATSSEAENRIRAMISLAKSEVPVQPEELDTDPFLLNAKNGTIDLRTGEMREHRRDNLITKLAPVEYDPDASAPTFEAFLERVLPNEEVRRFVQRAAGYSATGDTSERCMFIHHGPGANGKSTYQEAVAAALGDYAMRTPTETLLVKRAGGVPNDVARLKGARLVTAAETEEGRRLDESLIKDLTGQDTISARFMRAEWFDFQPTHKLHLSTNHKPEIRGTDPAIWSRIRLVPWSVVIPPAERDRGLAAKLRAELPGVLAYAVRGAVGWSKGGLEAPDEVRRATAAYRSEQDVLGTFIDDRCAVAHDAETFAKALFEAYKDWCETSGERAETQRRFGMRLTERGFARAKVGGLYKWYGIELRTGVPGPVGGDNGPAPEPTAANGPAPEKPSFAGKVPVSNSLAGPSGPENTINGLEIAYVGVNENKGPDGPDGPDCNKNGASPGEDFAPSCQSETPHRAPRANEGIALATGGDNPSLADGGSAPGSGRGGNDVVWAGSRQLTLGEAQDVQRLIGQGRSASMARTEVLAKRHPLGCECEMCE